MKNNTTGVWAVIPAAGIGSRMNLTLPKQYLVLNGKTVLQHSIERLWQVDGVKGIVVALNENDHHWPTLNLSSDIPVHTVVGGEQRMHSVFFALQWLREEHSFDGNVLVHDAARPCVRPDDIEKLIQAVGVSADGGLLAVPLADTLKRSADDCVAETISRENLWQAQTPQYFPLAALYVALERAVKIDDLVTDEAQAMERMGCKPMLVCGHADNIKITHTQDIERAKHNMQIQTDTSLCARDRDT